MHKKRKRYICVTEEQIRQAALDLERQENMDLEQEIAEANAWAEANHIVRRPFPEVPPKKRPVRQSFRPRRDTSFKIAKKSRLKPYVQLAAGFLIVLFGGWYTQTDSVQGMRLDLVNLFTKEVRDKGTMELKGQGEWSGYYLPEYIPDGFKLEDSYKSLTQNKYTQIFKSISGETITIVQSTENVAYTYLDENDYSEIMIQDKYRAHLYFQNNVWYITWFDDHNIFVTIIVGTDIQEGLNFINSLKWSRS